MPKPGKSLRKSLKGLVPSRKSSAVRVVEAIDDTDYMTDGQFKASNGIPSNYVLVKVDASSVSARDWAKTPNLPRSMLPFIPGYEFVGTIQTLGDTVQVSGQLREGDLVAGVSAFGGGQSRFITIPAGRVTKIPNNVNSTQAVCMIHDYMAALNALRLGKSGCGSTYLTGMNILATDGFSPVGQAVINLAGLEGANVYCCAEESKHSYLAGLGARCLPVNPRSWLPTSTGTFDIVIDNSCIDAYSSSRAALNERGSLVCLAPVYKFDGDDGNCGCGINMADVNQMWAETKAKYMMSQTNFLDTEKMYTENTSQYKHDLRYLMFLLGKQWIIPKVSKEVTLDEVFDAQYVIQSGNANGTTVCTPWKEIELKLQEL